MMAGDDHGDSGVKVTVLTGRIARKKKRKQGIELAIRDTLKSSSSGAKNGGGNKRKNDDRGGESGAADDDDDPINPPSSGEPTEQQQQQQQPPLVMCIIKSDTSLLVKHPVFVQLDALVRVTHVPDSSLWCSLRVTSLEFLQCPGEPKAVQQILKEPSLWYSLRPSTTRTSNEDEDEEEPLDFQTKNQHYLVRQIVARLQGRDYQKETPRERPPVVKYRTLQALEQLEQATTLVNITWNNSNNMDLVCLPTNNQNWNLPDGGSIPLQSHHHKITRQEYLQRKKFPQIGWSLTRLKQMRGGQKADAQQSQQQQQQQQQQQDHPPNNNHPAPSSSSWYFRHVLDVGGGRGDIAIQVAQTFPDCHVTVIDLNETSLEAGKAYATQQGVGDRMHWICQDFRDYCRDHDSYSNNNHNTQEQEQHDGEVTTTTTTQASPPPPPPKIDLVIAWHACGDLSDLALQIGIDLGAALMVCPCCYSKITRTKTKTKAKATTTSSSSSTEQPQTQPPTPPHHQERDISVATNLAELEGRPDLSRRGMHIINSLRFQNLIHHGYQYVSLEEYTKEWSGRNQVLVAHPSQQTNTSGNLF